MTTTEVELWQDPDGLRAARRAERERRRQKHRMIVAGMLSFALLFAGVIVAKTISNSHTPEAGASETIPPPTSAPIAPEWETSTTVPTPETLPVPAAPQWITVRVAAPGFDGLGKLVTDGQPGHCDRVLPGALGRAVVAIPFDPTPAGTVVVDGKEYRVFSRSTVAANDLGSLCDLHPIIGTVVVVSTVPGDARPFVEAKADAR